MCKCETWYDMSGKGTCNVFCELFCLIRKGMSEAQKDTGIDNNIYDTGTKIQRQTDTGTKIQDRPSKIQGQKDTFIKIHATCEIVKAQFAESVQEEGKMLLVKFID